MPSPTRARAGNWPGCRKWTTHPEMGVCWRESGSSKADRVAPRDADRAGWGALLLGAALVACSGPPGAGRRLGEDLGTFQVEAVESGNTCGPAALGSTERFDFEVELARADSELFWDGRAGGQVRATLDFEIATENTFTLRRPVGPDGGCAITRRDGVSGTLRSNAAGEIDAFLGEMIYDFAEALLSTCTAEEQQAAGLPLLPCRLSYELDATRTRVPEGLAREAGADLK